MKTNFANNYKSIQATMDSNIATIKILIDQADNLNEIIKSLNGDPEQKGTKDKMEKIIGEINITIGALIDQTTSLFIMYKYELAKM